MSPAHPAPSDLGSVSALLPTYEFEGLIAHSESSSIFKARHRSLDRDVAIKIIPRDFRGGHSDKAGAKVMAGLNHPNLIRVYDSGEAGEFFFVVMEYVPGRTLENCARGKAIHPRQASEIIIAACEGLAHAHASGVIHGGINPSNILLNSQCEPKISNFGNPPRADEATALSEDVFALGLILRELLTGVPSESDQAASVIIPDMKLAMICRKATHLDPERRYPDAGALGEALTRAMTPVENKPPVAKPHATQQLRQKPVAAVGAGHQRGGMFGKCAVIALLLFSICGVWAYGQAKQERIARLQSEEDAKPKVVVVRAAASKAGADTALVSWER